MTGDSNIRDNLWDPLYPHHSSLSNDLFIIADCFNLGLSIPTNQVPTRYSDNCYEANSVIDPMFPHYSSSEIDNHMIHPDQRLTLDCIPLTIVIPIIEEHIQTKKYTIVKDSDKEHAVNEFTSSIDNIWTKNSKIINITVHSKS